MVIAALVSFGLLLVAWLVAPADMPPAAMAIAPPVDAAGATRLAEVA